MSAIFSDCGNYRYELRREVCSTGKLVYGFSGMNPSIAGAKIEDQTSMKWRGFTLRNDGCRYIAFNPFALKSTDVRKLATAVDPVGPLNRYYTDQIFAEVDVLVPCWGALAKIPTSLHRYVHDLRDRIFASGKPVKIFGLTKSGDPKHPLMLGYNTPLIDWTPNPGAAR